MSLAGDKSTDHGRDAEFQWGKLPQQDNSGQVTRYMMEMRKPKPYELAEPPPLNKAPRSESPGEEIDVPSCPIMIHSIKLLRYMRKVRKILFKLNSQDPDDAYSEFNRLSPELLSPPAFESESSDDVTVQRRSGSSSSSKADDNDGDDTEKSIFVAPNVSSDFRCGIKNETYPNLDDDTASKLLKKSVGTIAAQVGFEKATSSSLDVLTGIAESFIVSFTKSLRDAADAEALEGKTPFFDCLDQAMHDSGCASFKEIQDYWHRDVVKRHKGLTKEAERLAKALKSFDHPARSEEPKKVNRMQARTTGFTTAYGKWTPVAGMSSSPYPANTVDEGRSSSAWIRQTNKFAVKSEPQDSGQASGNAFTGLQQDTLRPKTEYSGFEFSTRSPNIEL